MIGASLIEKRSRTSALAHFGVEGRKTKRPGGRRQKSLRLGGQRACTLGASHAPLRESQLDEEPAARSGLASPYICADSVESHARRRTAPLERRSRRPSAAISAIRRFRAVTSSSSFLAASRSRQATIMRTECASVLVGNFTMVSSAAALRLGEAGAAESAKAVLPCVKALPGGAVSPARSFSAHPRSRRARD